MNAVLITTAVCGGYAVFGFAVIRYHDRPVPHWWRRMVAALRRSVRAVAAALPAAVATARFWVRRLLALARLRLVLVAFSLHVLFVPMGVSHR